MTDKTREAPPTAAYIEGLCRRFVDVPTYPVEVEPTLAARQIARAYLSLAERLKAASACAECLSHAETLGHLGDGSTLNWAKTALAVWRAQTAGEPSE
jgi:hypothetical protein